MCRTFNLFIEQLFNSELTSGTNLKLREVVSLSSMHSRFLFLTVAEAEEVFPGTILVELIGMTE